MINSGVDYDSHFPAGYGERYTRGLRLLRVAARAPAEHGWAAVGHFYQGGQQRDLRLARCRLADARHRGQPGLRRTAARQGSPAVSLADALDDTRWDEGIRAEGDEALAPTGRDVGTHFIQFGPRPAAPSSAQ